MVEFARVNFSLDAVRPKFERAFDDFSDVLNGAGWYEDHNRPLTGAGLDYRPLYASAVVETPNDFEKTFWGNCTNTLGEEQKQFVYAHLMGLDRQWHSFPQRGRRIADIGGGPVSMLLKSTEIGAGSIVVDPLGYPDWVLSRYAANGIQYVQMRGEDWHGEGFDEVWIYNCLQHVDDPGQIIRNALAAAPVLRIFEWINFPAYDGHPQALTQELLESWIGQAGTVVHLNNSGCNGDSFSGVFIRKGLELEDVPFTV
jgi:hypothetical protein